MAENNVKLVGPINSGIAAGGAGVATATGTTTVYINGLLYAIYVKYNDSPPAGTTDVTVTTDGTAPRAPAQTLLTLTNAATDGYFYPRIEVESTAGAGVSFYDLIPIADKIDVTIAQANNNDNIDVWLLLV